MKYVLLALMFIYTVSFAFNLTAQERHTWVSNGHEYFVTETKMDWQTAKAYAESVGGHLVTIESGAEQAWLVETVLEYANAVPYTGCCLFVWIGVTDEVQEGVWEWVTGEPLTFTGWLSGEPNNANVTPGGEDYAALGTLSPGTPNGWGWYDYPSPLWFGNPHKIYAIVEIPTCLADVNGDGTVSPADFTAWIHAYNAGDQAADQNGDGSISPPDFVAFISNFHIGC